MAQWNKNQQDYLNQGRTLHEVMLIADSQGNIINDFGGSTATSPPGGADIFSRIDIAAGTYTGYAYINKFGYREIPASLTAYYSVTSQGTYTFPTATDTATVTSSDAGDDNGGTVLVSGLDGDYNQVEETITIGQSGTQQFLRVHRARLVTANTGSTNSGNITVEVDGDTVAYIPSGYGQTLQCAYTVPAGHTAYIFQIDCGVDEKEKPVHFRIVTRDNTVANAAWNTRQFIVMESNYVSQNQTVPIKVTEKSDILLEANSTAGQIEVSGGFDLVLKSNT